MIVDRSPFAQMLSRPDADIQLRAYYESLRGWLQSEQSSWLSHWSQLSRFFLPRHARFNYADVDRGDRKDLDLVDNTGTVAVNTAVAGVMSGMSNSAREWFGVRTSLDELNEVPEVQDYLEHGADEVRHAMLKSNFYPTVHSALGDLFVYGTQSFSILEDEEDLIRCYPNPIGSYFISGDNNLRIDLIMRTVNMTARQMVAQYGIDNVSSQIRAYYESNAGGLKEQWWPVVQVVHPNTYYGDEADKYMPYVSVHYEMNNFSPTQTLLRRSGYFDCPTICSRFGVTGENFYGNSPCMTALGDQMSLQMKERRKAEAIDKMVKPPMVASPAMMNAKMSILPGDITFGDTKDGHLGFKPAYEMKFDVGAAEADQEKVRGRINEALFKNLFLMISSDDKTNRTAAEIQARQQEKMMVLGPFLERNNGEMFAPAIRRIWGILRRQGRIPAPPEVLKGQHVSFEFESVLAQAQRMMKITAMERLNGFVGNQAAVNPGSVDIIDFDKENHEYAEALGIQAGIMRSAEDLQKIREAKQQQQQAQQQADMAQKLAPAAQTLSQTDMNGDSALTRLLGTLGQS